MDESKKNYQEIIRRHYLELLNREPDEVGFNYYLNLMEKNEIDEKKLLTIFKNSDEYKRIQSTTVYKQKQPYVFKGLHDIYYKIHPVSILDDIIVNNGIYDKWIATRLRKLIPSTGIIFDVGAHEGLLTLPFAKLHVPQGSVYAFEPNSEIRNRLEENIKINQIKNVIVEPLALQDNPLCDKITFYRRRAICDDGHINDGLSSIQQNTDYNVSKEVVRASTIDRYIKDNNISNLNFIKIDAEGADFRILQGSNKTIEQKDTHILNTISDYKKLDEEHNQLYQAYKNLEKEHNRLNEEHNQLYQAYKNLEKEHNRLNEEHNRLYQAYKNLEKEHNRLNEDIHNSFIWKMLRKYDNSIGKIIPSKKKKEHSSSM